MPVHMLATARALPVKCTDSTLALVFRTRGWQNELCHDKFGFTENHVIVPKTLEQRKVKFLNNSISELVNRTQ